MGQYVIREKQGEGVEKIDVMGIKRISEERIHAEPVMLDIVFRIGKVIGDLIPCCWRIKGEEEER